ncbi:Transcription factor MYB82, partial [Mucuna pruriens]
METKCCEIEGAWSSEEEEILINYVQVNGEGNWRDFSKRAGLKRCDESCKHRWLNYLKPAIHRRNISPKEEDLIIRMHKLVGNRIDIDRLIKLWSIIAGRLPGRTENEIENIWNNYLSKKEEINY